MNSHELRPRLLDLFCGGGGATRGYQLAGFHVTGVDVVDQPNYCGDVFVRGDAAALLTDTNFIGQFTAVSASPPCQQFTAYRRRGDGVGEGYPNLIAATRAALEATGLPYVIENVPGAPLVNPVQLCGSSFGLDVRRHRLFETNWPLLVPPCAHGLQRGDYPQATNRANRRRTVEVGVWRIPLATQQAAMGIDWMTLPELTEAIPPAFTRYVGDALLEHVTLRVGEVS